MLLDIFDPKAPPKAIGIDLGTTNSIVAVARDDGVSALITCDGTALLPSVVHYGDHNHVVVGRAAQSYQSREPAKTISSAKRFMGRSHAECAESAFLQNVLAPPTTEAEEKTVRFDVGGRVVSPIEVSAEILKSLKRSAIDQLNAVGGAVITVPAYFDDAQRQATKDAARLAGVEVLRLLNEPTAAALAYGLDQRKAGVFAVYDLGGGTFDVTVLLLDDGVFQVKSTGGDSQLGGDDVDHLIAEKILEKMGFTSGEAQPPEVVALAVAGARELKHALTDEESVSIDFPARGGSEASLAMTRSELAQLVLPLLEKTGRAAKRALRDAGLDAKDLDGVILVGGSTRMPAVRDYVAALFAAQPLSEIDPELVVAYGAAQSAAALSGQADELLLLDVLPLSLGVETMGGGVDKILPRNTTIPAGARSTFTTYADNQTGFELHVLQGERELASDCRSLARFTLKGIPPMPAGVARLEIEFSVDENSLLSVAARELTTGIEQKIEVRPSYGLTDEQIEDMLIDALENGEEDLEARRLADAAVEASRVILATEKSLADDAGLLAEGERLAIDSALAELRAVLDKRASGKPPSASLVQVRLDALDAATHDWAGRRMNKAIGQVLSGQGVSVVEESVQRARGVDAHVQEHERNRASRDQ